MSGTWFPKEESPPVPVGPMGWLRVVGRGIPMILVILFGLLILMMIRLIERPICGLNRPVSPYVTQLVCKTALAIMGMRLIVRGDRMTCKGAVVANHASWLDIFTLNAAKRIYFVAKVEVASWPLIGWLARATGTVFIARRSLDAKIHLDILDARLNAGHKLMVFPEGTSTDGLRVISFKSTLFEAFFTQSLREVLHIQPATVKYSAPAGQEDRFYGWWGDMDLAPHLLKILAVRRQGSVEIIYHAPVAVVDFDGRKSLARYCEDTVRSGMA